MGAPGKLECDFAASVKKKFSALLIISILSCRDGNHKSYYYTHFRVKHNFHDSKDFQPRKWSIIRKIAAFQHHIL